MRASAVVLNHVKMTRSAYKYTKPNWNWNAYVLGCVTRCWCFVRRFLLSWLCFAVVVVLRIQENEPSHVNPIDWKSKIHFCSTKWHKSAHRTHIFVISAWDWFWADLFDLVPLIRTIAIICTDLKWSWKQKVILTLSWCQWGWVADFEQLRRWK